MSTRTKHSVFRFTAPFVLAAVDDVQPAGDYAVDRDEEAIDDLSWLVWQRVGTFMHLPAIGTASGLSRFVPVDPAELETGQELEPAAQASAG